MSSGSGNVSSVVGLGMLQNPTSPLISIPLGATPVTLMAGFSLGTGAANSYWYFAAQRAPGGQYQVPAGKTFTGVPYTVQAGNPGPSLVDVGEFGTSTATFTNNTASVPTGAVYYAGTSGANDGPFPILSFGSVNSQFSSCVWQSYPFIVQFSAALYPFWKWVGTPSRTFFIALMGYEA